MRAKQLRQGILVGVLMLVALWLVSLIWGLAGKARIAISEARDTRGQYQALEARKVTLAANLAELDTPRGQDDAIRTAFGVAKSGEEVIVVVPPTPAPPAPPKPWWVRLWSWL